MNLPNPINPATELPQPNQRAHRATPTPAKTHIIGKLDPYEGLSNWR